MDTPITIAIVEDDPLIAQFLSEVLGDEGYTVRAFPDGRSGLAAIIAQPPTVVLLDLNLPSMRGEDVLVGIRQHLGAALPIVIMTASTQRQNAERPDAVHLVCVGYLHVHGAAWPTCTGRFALSHE